MICGSVIWEDALVQKHDGIMPWRIVVRCLTGLGPLESGAVGFITWTNQRWLNNLPYFPNGRLWS